MDYWYNNHSIWFPEQTRAGVNWEGIGVADCQGVLDSFGLVGGWAPFVAAAAKLAFWQAELVIVAAFAATYSILEAIAQDEAIDDDITAGLGHDFCVDVAEKAIIEYAFDSESGSEDGGLEEGNN